MSEYDVIFNMRVYGRPDGHPIYIDPLKEAVKQFVKEQCVRDCDVIEVRENSGASAYFKVVVSFEECDKPKSATLKDESEKGHVLTEYVDYTNAVFPATAKDYYKWMSGYTALGGTPTHAYDYAMPVESIFVATKNFSIRPLFGSLSIGIIIPNGIVCENPTNRGHTNLFYMDGYRHTGFVPMYDDIAAMASGDE